MNNSLRTSSIRLVVGAALTALALATAAFILPDASQKRTQQQRAAKEAMANYQRQQAELLAAQAQAEHIRVNREALDSLMQNMPVEPVGRLSWRLSKTLYDLTAKHSVRLIAVKYGAPAKEGTKGMQLESVDVEFTVTGIFMNLKSFMLSLETGKLPFAVVSAKLDESPEGGHLNIVLRAFRQTGEAPVGEPS